MKTNKYFSRKFWFGCRSALFLAIALSGLLLPLPNVQAQGKIPGPITPDGTTFLFSYKNTSGILVKNYLTNNSKCGQMIALINRYQSDLSSDKSHLLITAYIRPRDLNNPKMINTASIQANVVRSYIKVMNKIYPKQMTFVFDTTCNINYQIRVDYLSTPIPKSANRFIYYVLSNRPDSIVLSAKRYRPIPLAVPSFCESEKKAEAVNLNSEAVTASATPRLESTAEILNKETVIQPEPNDNNDNALRAFKPKKIYHVVLDVKTNLLYWAGITPELKQRYMTPNLEIDWRISKHWSLNAEARYYHMKHRDDKSQIWRVLAIGVEPRFRIRGNGQYTNFYTGIYGLMGNFDVRLNSISPYGYSGIFSEAGVSTGYLLPLSKRWGLEAGIRYGYRKSDYDSYNFAEPNIYYFRSAFNKKEFKLTGIRLLATYRLGLTEIK